MSTRILVGTTPIGEQLKDAINKLLVAQQGINRVLGTMNRMTTGSPPDFESVKSEFGLLTAQDAEDLVYLVNSGATAFNASIITEMAERLDQGG